MTEAEVEKLLVSIAAEQERQTEFSNTKGSDLPYGRTEVCLDSSRVRDVLLGNEQWKAGEEEHTAQCRYCTATLKIVEHQIKNPLIVAHLGTVDSPIENITKPGRGQGVRVSKGPLKQKRVANKPRSVVETDIKSKETRIGLGRVAIAGFCVLLVGLVSFSLLRRDPEAELPQIAQLENDSRNLISSQVRSGSENPTIPFPLSPKATAVRSDRPTFTWKNPQKGKKKIELFSATQTTPLISAYAEGDSWRPTNPLNPGIYSWRIGNSTVRPAFKVLSKDDLEKVIQQEETPLSDNSRAALYLSYQLYSESKPILQRIYSKTKDKNLIPYLRVVSNSH